jgi:hypothetical protein
MINIFLVKGFKAGEAVFGLMPGGAYAEVCIYIYNLVLENNNNKKKRTPRHESVFTNLFV